MIKLPPLTSWDFDNTLTTGLFSPKEGDIILTGRCYDEAPYVFQKLKELGIMIQLPIFFNPMPIRVRGDHNEEARIKSACHKVEVLNKLIHYNDVTHYDDDLVQIDMIRRYVPQVNIIVVPNPNGNFYGEANV
jgi:hypothetical protein